MGEIITKEEFMEMVDGSIKIIAHNTIHGYKKQVGKNITMDDIDNIVKTFDEYLKISFHKLTL